MPRNLIVCCDGTNNQFGAENSNVVRLVQVLSRESQDQLLFYDPGVGTLPEPSVATRLGETLSKWSALAFGTGLTRNVEEAYVFLMRFWEVGDRVFLFGFSRGAYTVRVLAGLLHMLGLLSRGNESLVPYLLRLFGGLGENESDGSKFWKLSNEFRRTFARPVSAERESRRFPVHFLGAWDTVSSVGWIWDPANYPFTKKNPGIGIVRHAVAIDERRWFFRQNQFAAADGQDFRELWFPGVHADVGGGYPESDGGLWRIPFRWMVEEAQAAGMGVDQSRLDKILEKSPAPEQPWAEPAHESLTWKWWPCEFFPKLPWRSGGRIRVPRIGAGRSRFVPSGSHLHRAALLRIRSGRYAPPNLSSEFLGRVRGLSEVPETLAYEP